MLRDSPRTSFGGRKSERTTMGNLATAEELAGDELEELYRLDATETGPEEEEEVEAPEEEEMAPRGMPHEEPGGIPH